MTVNELWKVSPQAHVFIVVRDLMGRKIGGPVEYTGFGGEGGFKVTRVTPAQYPSYGLVLETEIDGEE